MTLLFFIGILKNPKPKRSQKASLLQLLLSLPFLINVRYLLFLLLLFICQWVTDGSDLHIPPGSSTRVFYLFPFGIVNYCYAGLDEEVLI